MIICTNFSMKISWQSSKCINFFYFNPNIYIVTLDKENKEIINNLNLKIINLKSINEKLKMRIATMNDTNKNKNDDINNINIDSNNNTGLIHVKRNPNYNARPICKY